MYTHNMADPLVAYLRVSLPSEVAVLAESYLERLEHGEYEQLLQCPEARTLFGREQDPKLQAIKAEDFGSWNDLIFQRLGAFLSDRSQPEKQIAVFCIGYAALLAFLQSNVTGPPLKFTPSDLILPDDVAGSEEQCRITRQKMLAGLSTDGIAAYKLTPNIELLCLADAVMTCPPILKNIKAARWAKIRVSFMHQRLLSEVSSTLQNSIYDDLELLEADLNRLKEKSGPFKAEFRLERSTIHIHHGLDKFARSDLEEAKSERRFDFALTGLLGRRTKFQQFDTSQLVVLAKSASDEQALEPGPDVENGIKSDGATNPTNLDLNDDTLLESISFAEKPADASSTDVVAMDSLPPSLKALDPANQPQLQPLDSVVLLLLASSITNTSPQDGLTREETIPYATRVLDGGSSNWQVYTQALLVRSRIEGYRSRTVERGLLQLQALVDQVIAETTAERSSGFDAAASEITTSTFLPKAKDSESAPVTERLRYVFQLASPTRWELEAELAARWVQLGGLRSALEIYERLEMWAEAALCWAATEREDKAQRLVRRQLFHATNGGPDVSETGLSEDEEWEGPARQPPPLDAPRLYCILGDIGPSIEMYETAWEVSNKRYARAQRSIGRHFFSVKDFVRSAEGYSKSLTVNQLNHSSWFALGCALLELAQFEKAVGAFSRVVQLDDTDAEAWSNLAAALLKTDPESAPATRSSEAQVRLDDEEDDAPEPIQTPAERHLALRGEALQALKRAASLKHESYRIWENVLIVAASLSPPDYASILAAQKRIIDLRGKTDGEKCIDVEILQMLVSHIITMNDTYDQAQPGITRMIVKFIDDTVVPLITGSAVMWQLVGKLALWRNKPSTALDAEEKAWRAITSQPGWETESEKRWNEVVEATVRLSDSYESLGPKERTEGMGAGEVVMKDWKFKARSAVRGIMGRGKDSWEDTEGWERLRDVTEGLRG